MAHGQARARAGRGDEECGNAKTKEKGALLSHARHTKGGGAFESPTTSFIRVHIARFLYYEHKEKGSFEKGNGGEYSGAMAWMID